MTSPTAPRRPSDDRRWKVVDARRRRLGYRPDAVVEALHSAQDSFGFPTDVKPGTSTRDSTVGTTGLEPMTSTV